MTATECVRKLAHWCNLASLADLRDAMRAEGIEDRSTQNVAILAAWKAREVSLTPPDRKPDARTMGGAIVVAGEMYCYISTRS